MKLFLLISFFFLGIYSAHAQDAILNNLPSGRYETLLRSSTSKWDKGDIILVDNSHYKLSASTETGDYRFSAAAQKVFFTSGPLKGAVAKTSVQSNKPVILLPVAENQNIGLSLATSDIVAVLKN
jgi:hypothetical protein